MKRRTQDEAGLPDEIRAALEKVIEYYWLDELNDYDGTPADERAEHIFARLRLLRRWLDDELELESVDVKLLFVRGEDYRS